MRPTEILIQEHRVIERVLDCLEKMADQAFNEQDQTELLERFEQAEREVIGEATKARYVALADRLAERYRGRHLLGSP